MALNIKNLRTLFKRKCQYILLSKDKIARKKRSLNVSANDIIMSCLCEMCGSSDIFAFDKSVRGIKDGVPKGAAGNFFIEIPFDVENGKDPSAIHKIGKDGYFGTNSIPLLPFLNGRVGRITSLASITHQANFPGSDVVCQFPSASFIKDLPLDVAVIFRFDKVRYVIYPVIFSQVAILKSSTLTYRPLPTYTYIFQTTKPRTTGASCIISESCVIHLC